MARIAIGADEKKKLYMLGGVAAALGVAIFALYLPHGAKPTTPTPTPASMQRRNG